MPSLFKKWWVRAAAILAVIGPGIITANADNDAGGIATYSIVGAHFGTKMLWVLLALTVALAITQEMGVRIGMVTRQGLAGIIRENFPIGWTVFAMLAMLIANLGTVTAEFAGIAASFSIFGLDKYVVIPIAALLIWLILYKGSFKTTQKIFLLFSTFYIVYIINGFSIHPDFVGAFKAMFTPQVEWTQPFMFTLIAMIGTTITPWGQFFIQSYAVDKGLDIKHYTASRLEVYFGAVLTNIVSFFIIVSTATVLFPLGIHIADAKDAALALEPLAGQSAQVLFAFGLFSASMLGAFILPVATSYALCEAFGWESGFDSTWQKGKIFYSIILASIIIPAGIVLLPQVSFIKILVWSQGLNGVLLPVILFFVMRIINKKELMGEYVNKRLSNVVGWCTIGVIMLASLTLVVLTILHVG